MSNRALLALPFSIAAAAVASAPTQGAPLQPTEKWIVNFDDAQCVASRSYGSEDRPLHLVLKQPPVGEVVQLAIIEGGSTGLPVQLEGTLTFEDHPPIKISALLHKPKGAKVRTYLVNLPADQFEPARTAKSLRIKTRAFEQSFALIGIQPLLKVMSECVADLRNVWNVRDPHEEISTLSEEARGSLAGIFSANDYPIDAVRGDQSGTVGVALLVDETGKVADCSVIATSGVAILDAQTCAILRERARFKPAVGPDGKPAKTAWIQRITWRTV